MLKILITFVTKQVTLVRRSTVLSLPFHLVFPELRHAWLGCHSSMDYLMKRKDKHSWPSCINSFRLAHFKLKILFTFVSKQVILTRRSTVLNLLRQLEFPELRLVWLGDCHSCFLQQNAVKIVSLNVLSKIKRALFVKLGDRLGWTSKVIFMTEIGSQVWGLFYKTFYGHNL
jgi:hypothetical protein